MRNPCRRTSRATPAAARRSNFVRIGTSYSGASLRLAHRGEHVGLHAGEADMVAELGQAFRQQVLHPFGAGVVLAIDQVQHAHGAGRRGRVAWRQRRQRGRRRRGANGNLVS